MADSYATVVNECVSKKLAFIAEHRERLVAAWTETGMPPSESVLCLQDVVEGGKVTTRIWVDRKRETDVAR